MRCTYKTKQGYTIQLKWCLTSYAERYYNKLGIILTVRFLRISLHKLKFGQGYHFFEIQKLTADKSDIG